MPNPTHPMDQPFTLKDMQDNVALKHRSFYELIKMIAEADTESRKTCGIRDNDAFVGAVERYVKDYKKQLEALYVRYENDNPDN